MIEQNEREIRGNGEIGLLQRGRGLWDGGDGGQGPGCRRTELCCVCLLPTVSAVIVSCTCGLIKIKTFTFRPAACLSELISDKAEGTEGRWLMWGLWIFGKALGRAPRGDKVVRSGLLWDLLGRLRDSPREAVYRVGGVAVSGVSEGGAVQPCAWIWPLGDKAVPLDTGMPC